MDFFTGLFVTYAGEKLLDRLFFTKAFPDNLRAQVKIWMNSFPPESRFEPAALFPPLHPESHSDDKPTLERLKAELGANHIPSIELWEETLLEHWSARKRELGESAIDFFKLDRGAVQSSLHELAVLLHQACVQDTQLFRGEVLKRLPDKDAATDAAFVAFLGAHRNYCLQFPYASFYERLSAGLPRSLDQVFVPLGLQRILPGVPSSTAHSTEAPIIAAPELVRQLVDTGEAHPILLLGEPGMGKSTLLRHIGTHAWHAPEKVGLSKPLIPLLLRLRWIAAAEGASRETRIRSAMDIGGELTLDTDPPLGFLAEWPRHAATGWLFLFDGLDEVPRTQLGSCIQWLQSFFQFAQQTNNRVILTSRPQEAAENLAGYVDFVRISGFHVNERTQLASRWFGERAETFLAAVANVRGGAVTNSPLLMSIAAAIFHRDGRLPKQRAGLYDRSVDICLAEAEAQGLSVDLEDRLAKLTRSMLEFLAYRSIQHDRADGRDKFVRWSAQYIHRTMGRSTRESTVDAERAIETIGRRSGILVNRRGTCTWVHPSFGEYLAASQLDRILDPSSDESTEFMLKWRDPAWRQVVTYLVSRWGERDTDIKELMMRLTARDMELALQLCLETFEEISLPRQAIDVLVNNLTTKVILNKHEQIGTLRERPIGVLARVATIYPEARLALRKIVQNVALEGDVRHEAVGAMLKSEDLEGFRTLLGEVWIWKRIGSYWWDLVDLNWTADVDNAAVRAFSSLETPQNLRRFVADFVLKRRSGDLASQDDTTITKMFASGTSSWIAGILYPVLGDAAGDIGPLIGSSEGHILIKALAAGNDSLRALLTLTRSNSLEPNVREMILTSLVRSSHAQMAVQEADNGLGDPNRAAESGMYRRLLQDTVRWASAPLETRRVALRVLARHAGVAELRGLSTDRELDPSLQEAALEQLIRYDETEVLREIAVEAGAPPWSRYSAIRLLLERGHNPRHSEILKLVLNDVTLPETLRCAIERLQHQQEK